MIKSVKRLGAAVLSAVMMLTAVATPLGDNLPAVRESTSLTAGAVSEIDKAGVLDRISQLKSLFPDGSYFSVNGKACNSSNASTHNCSNCRLGDILSKNSKAHGTIVPSVCNRGGCYTCLAFARFSFCFIFGHDTNTNITEIDSKNYGGICDSFVSKLKPGDYLECFRNGTFVHAAIYLGCDLNKDLFYVYESNYGNKVNEPGQTNKVRYNNSRKYSRYDRILVTRSKSYVDTIDLKSTPSDIGSEFESVIRCTSTGKVLSAGSDNNVTAVSYNGSNNQLWKFYKNSDNYYKIVNVGTGKRLDVNNAGTADGTNIQVWTDNDSSAQRWGVYGSQGSYLLKPKYSTSSVLDSGGGNNNVHLWTYASNIAAQKFTIEKMPSTWFSDVTAKNIKTNDARIALYANKPASAKATKYSIEVWQTNNSSNKKSYSFTPSGNYPNEGVESKQIYFDMIAEVGFTLSSATQYSYKITQYFTYLGASMSRTSGTYSFTTLASSSHTHSYGSWYTKTSATCTSGGTEERKCSCGATESRSTSALGHNYGSWSTVTNATCTSGGSEKRTCSRCSNSETRSTSALGHNFGSTYFEAVHPHKYAHLCQRCGYKEFTGGNLDYYEKCDTCNKPGSSAINISYADECGKVIFNWTATDKTEKYVLKIFKDKAWQESAVQIIETNETSYSLSLPAGTYEAYVDSCNGHLYTCSNIVSFNVEEHEYDLNVVNPTYDNEGYTLHTCTKCGSNYKDNITEKLDKSAINNLLCIEKHQERVKLSWNKPTYSAECEVEVYQNNEWKICNNIYTTYSGEVSIYGLNGATEYKFRVRLYVVATDNAGSKSYSNYSEVITVTTPCDYEYSLNSDGTVTIMNYIGNDEIVTVPAMIDGKPVIMIDRWAFKDNNTVKKCIISQGIQHIYCAAFGSSLGGNNSIESIFIPESVTCIDTFSLYLGAPFANCTALKEIVVDPQNKYYSSEDGVLYNKEKTVLLAYPAGKTEKTFTVPEGIISIETEAFCSSQALTEIKLPDSLLYIEGAAFNNCKALKKVNCPKNLVSIEASAFYNCVNLSEVTIPDSVTDIGQNAFDETNIVNSQNSAIKYVGKWVVNFTDKTAEDVTVKDGTVGIAQCAFDGGVALKSVRLPDSLLYINDNAFSYCKNLSNVNIGDKVKYIGRYAFDETPILKNQDTAVKYIGNWLVDCDKDVTNVIVKDGTYGISSSAFSYAKLQTITIPESVKVILREAFSGTPLIDHQSGDVKYADNWIIDCNEKATKVQIKEETVGIADSAFSFCNNITEIVLPDSLETINDNAFFNCTGLSSMVIPTTVKNISLNAIGYISPAYAQGYNHQQTEGFVLNVYSNTAGENYAKINRFNYTVLDDINKLTRVKVKTHGTASLTLAWDKNASANGYVVEQYKGGKWTQIAKTSSNATVTYTVNGLKADTTYTFRIKGYVVSGTTEYSGEYTRLAAKTRIANVGTFKGSTVSDSAVKLDWSKNDKATGYVIEQYKGGKWTVLATTKNNTTLTFTVKGLAEGTAYSFRIKSFRKTGSTTDFSEYTAIKAATLLDSVSNLKVTSVTGSWITLEWAKNDKATGYSIEQYKGGKWTVIATTKNNTTLKFTVKGLKNDTTYSFRIRAYKTAGVSNVYSDYVRIAGKTRIPNVATFKGSAASASAVKLDWSKNDKATGYVIEQYKGGKWTALATTKNNTTLTFTVKGLAKGTTYSFRIKSFRKTGSTIEFSEYASVKVKTVE